MAFIRNKNKLIKILINNIKMMISYFNLKQWINDILVIENTQFNLSEDKQLEQIFIGKSDKICFIINWFETYVIIETYENKTKLKDKNEIKLFIVNLIIENGIPFIIEPLTSKIRKYKYHL